MKITAADVLAGMAATYRQRNAIYGDNYRMVGKLMAILFPRGAPPALLHSDHFHLLELLVVKLARFAVSRATHADSIHDAAIYAAMIEACLVEKSCSNKSARRKSRATQKGRQRK